MLAYNTWKNGLWVELLGFWLWSSVKHPTCWVCLNTMWFATRVVIVRGECGGFKGFFFQTWSLLCVAMSNRPRHSLVFACFRALRCTCFCPVQLNSERVWMTPSTEDRPTPRWLRANLLGLRKTITSNLGFSVFADKHVMTSHRKAVSFIMYVFDHFFPWRVFLKAALNGFCMFNSTANTGKSRRFLWPPLANRSANTGTYWDLFAACWRC